MNKQRREQINNLVGRIKQIKLELSLVNDKEQNMFDSIPENLQYSMRGCDSQDAIDSMDEAIDKLEDAMNCLSDII